jgi:hypothetical protein
VDVEMKCLDFSCVANTFFKVNLYFRKFFGIFGNELWQELTDGGYASKELDVPISFLTESSMISH